MRKISPKGITANQAVHVALDKYVACIGEASSGVVGATYGHVIEEPDKQIVVVGREVVCSCMACAQTDDNAVGWNRERESVGDRRDGRGGRG